MKLILLVLIFSGNLIHSTVLAHGEDKPGPYGGFIRMPGAYHTEIVPTDKNELKVYLLDLNWKNPSLKSSTVQLTISSDGAGSTAKCLPRESRYYLCSFPKNVDLRKKGSLHVTSQREGQKGNSVTYELPLRLMKIDDGHGDHKGTEN